MMLLKAIVLLSLAAVPGLAQTTTAPPPFDNPPPTRTIASSTYTFVTGFACGGKKLAQSPVRTYPDSSYTTTTSISIAIQYSYTCCTETLVRSDATPIPPTFTSYLRTTTTTSSIVCGGCEVTSLPPGRVYPATPTYTTTVTSPTTIETVYSCTARNLVPNTSDLNGACATPTQGPTFPRDFQAACLKTDEGLSGCPWECVLPIGTYPIAKCFAQDISHFWDHSPPPGGAPRYGCNRCLPQCRASSSTTKPTTTKKTTSTTKKSTSTKKPTAYPTH